MATANEELQAWLNGTPTGGPNGDGRYPLTYADGVVHLVLCPQAQALTNENDASAPQQFVVEAQAAATAAQTAQTAAESARDAAAGSKIAAGTSETNAKTSETNAKTSETNAASSATAASQSASGASTAKTAAETARDAAATSKTAAAASQTAAGTSETNAKTSETNAKTSETNAKTSETNAKTSETNAKTSETNAAASAQAASDAQAAAALSQANAADSESSAQTHEDNASASAATASAKASDAAASAQAASDSADAAAQSASDAQGYADSIAPSNLVHLSGNETITGVKTFGSTLTVPGPQTAVLGTVGWQLSVPNSTVSDSSTAANGTLSYANCVSLQQATLSANNTGVVYTDAATLFIGAAPAAGTNVTISNAWALRVNSGNSYFGGGVTVTGTLGFGAQTRQMINLWNTAYGIGVQGSTFYQRTGTGFAWYMGGVHSDTQNDPGAGGTSLMTLSSAGDLTIQSGSRVLAGAFQSTNTTLAPQSNPANAAFRAQGNYGGGYGLVDGSYGISLFSVGGALNFGFGTSSAVSSKAYIDANGQFFSIGSTPYKYRMVFGSYGSMWYQDSNNAYFLLTNANDQYGGFNTLRPFSVNLAGGGVSMNCGLGVTGGLSGDRIVCGWDSGNTGSVSCTNWFRSTGNTGWYSNDYGGGIYMIDATYLRSYNNKAMVASDFVISSDESLKSGIRPLPYRGRLTPITYTLTSSGATEIGFGAGAVREKYPELVDTDPVDGTLKLKYHRVTAVLSAQLNRLEDLVIKQQAQIEALSRPWWKRLPFSSRKAA